MEKLLDAMGVFVVVLLVLFMVFLLVLIGGFIEDSLWGVK